MLRTIYKPFIISINKMNIIDFTNKFQKIEIENNFFKEKNENGILYWDIVRYEIFNLIYNELSETKILPSKSINKISFIKRFLINLVGYFYYRYRIKNYKYICFIASRNKDKEGVSIDQVSEDILKQIHKESLIIETFKEANQVHKYTSVFDYGLLFEKYKNCFLQLFRNPVNQKNYGVSTILKERFKVKIDLNKEISKLLFNYAISFSYYLKLFRKVRPEVIFLVQNGIQKAIFSAANILKIPSVELQHGFIGYVHPAYSYPKSIKKGTLFTLPNYFFSFSDFWFENINYPVDKIIPFGNNYYALKRNVICKKYDITIIFANIYTADLLVVVDDLLKMEYSGEICIKLHPNQINELDFIKKHYIEHKNVHVVYNEKSMSEVLSVSNSVVAIQSTSVYEALYYGLKVFIIKVKNYQTHQNIFENPNVYLIDKGSQILDFINNEFIVSEQDIIFKEFNISEFLTFLERIEKRKKI